MVTGIGKLAWKLRTITHAYDTRVPVESKDDLIEQITWVKDSSKILNQQKSKVMSDFEY